MKHGWYWLAGFSGPFAAFAVRLRRSSLEQGLMLFWRHRQPDAVISFVPYLNASFAASLKREMPDTPLITVVTDMSSERRGHQWITPYRKNDDVNHIVVAGSPQLQQAAREQGFPESNILDTSGMVVHPSFYDPPPAQAMDSMRADAKLAVVFFGGFAPLWVATIVKRALVTHPNYHFLVLCGSNQKLKRILHNLAHPRCTAEGFVPAITIRDHFRRAAFVIGKPGPGVVAEACVSRVPFVTETISPMPQEKSVLDWLANSGVGILVDSLYRLPANLNARVVAATAAVRKTDNRAVFEATALLTRKLVEKGLDPSGVAPGANLNTTLGSFDTGPTGGVSSTGSSKPLSSVNRPHFSRGESGVDDSLLRSRRWPNTSRARTRRC
mmetsp:Transcript_14076/g.23354  ORF Transcript_14076/g.23354 Transcript_14076/m.23354 type:complete len:383 (-) Transcript_14076:414-1562(-)